MIGILWNSVYDYQGDVYEVRISDSARSDAWIVATDYSFNDNLMSVYQGQIPVFTASGTVTVDESLTNNIPVMLYRRSTGELVGSDTTHSGGLFEIDTPYDELHYITALYTSSGTNAITYDWITP